jgi:ubiquinone/menaquinone biosynthesis C-methylase UbiE
MNSLPIFSCPVCKGDLNNYFCKSCETSFEGRDGIPCFLSEKMYGIEKEYIEAMKVVDFWGHGWTKRLEDEEHAYVNFSSKEELINYANEELAWCRKNGSLISRLPFENMKNSISLNIGCGAGTEALEITLGGGSCIAMDITNPAAKVTDSLLKKLGQGEGIQGDARFLPFKDNSIDYVYSSGVLHHSDDVPKSISEIYRVLKPGGSAFIMLYATWSIMFIQQKMMMTKGEKSWETAGRKNPCTTTYSIAECQQLFSNFNIKLLEKRGGSFKHFAKIGQYIPTKFDFMVKGWLGCNINIIVSK